jgi:hypothetical protein
MATLRTSAKRSPRAVGRRLLDVVRQGRRGRYWRFEIRLCRRQTFTSSGPAGARGAAVPVCPVVNCGLVAGLVWS